MVFTSACAASLSSLLLGARLTTFAIIFHQEPNGLSFLQDYRPQSTGMSGSRLGFQPTRSRRRPSAAKRAAPSPLSTAPSPPQSTHAGRAICQSPGSPDRDIATRRSTNIICLANFDHTDSTSRRDIGATDSRRISSVGCVIIDSKSTDATPTSHAALFDARACAGSPLQNAPWQADSALHSSASAASGPRYRHAGLGLVPRLEAGAVSGEEEVPAGVGVGERKRKRRVWGYGGVQTFKRENGRAALSTRWPIHPYITCATPREFVSAPRALPWGWGQGPSYHRQANRFWTPHQGGKTIFAKSKWKEAFRVGTSSGSSEGEGEHAALSWWCLRGSGRGASRRAWVVEISDLRVELRKEGDRREGRAGRGRGLTVFYRARAAAT
ncbi:hypothetical protein B0H11DRAFT_2372775 [Mycena galericulata]|nr:hypothetical protein B0H11DRAFT_2372775 [Mycena galericulata]